MKREVYYYFSEPATACGPADILRTASRAEALIPIAARRETVETDAQTDRPRYSRAITAIAPVIVREFIGKDHGLPDKTLFAVCTFGGAEMDALRCLHGILARQGVFAGFGTHAAKRLSQTG